MHLGAAQTQRDRLNPASSFYSGGSNSYLNVIFKSFFKKLHPSKIFPQMPRTAARKNESSKKRLVIN